MSTVVAAVKDAPRSNVIRSWWFVLPIVLLVGAGVLANLGMEPTPKAMGASTDSVLVTATVGTVLDVADQCTGAMAVTVALNTYADGTCAIDFGSTNDATTFLRVSSSVGAFLSGGVFADEGAVCANLSAVDEAGLKVVSVAGAVTIAGAWGCAAGVATNNATTAHKGVPDAFTNICNSGAMTITNRCTLGIGVFESGSNAAPGAYAGTLNLDVIG